MELKDLKAAILEDSLSDEFMIFRCSPATKKSKNRPDCFFLANEFIDEICNRKGYARKNIANIHDTVDSAVSLIFDYATDLNVLTVEEFDEVVPDYSELKNIIVVCNSVADKLTDMLAEYIVDFKPANDWQTKAYINAYCPGLNDMSVDWLYEVTKGDLNRITNELDKLLVFDIPERQAILNDIRFEYGTDLYFIDFYPLIDAIINKNKLIVSDYLKHFDLFDYEAIGMTTALLQKYKKIAYVRYGNSEIVEAAGISSGFAYMINKNTIYYSEAELRTIIKFLSNIDYRLKNCELELTKGQLISYIISHILN